MSHIPDGLCFLIETGRNEYTNDRYNNQGSDFLTFANYFYRTQMKNS